jgi:hypothetical protein
MGNLSLILGWVARCRGVTLKYRQDFTAS